MSDPNIETHVASPALETGQPASGGFFESFLDSYEPSTEPFRVVMPKGEVLLFMALPDAASWEKLETDAKRMAKRLREGLPVALAAVASKSPSRNYMAYICAETMVGIYGNSREGDDGQIEPVGEVCPKWSFEAWLKFANRMPVLFDATSAKVDAGQINGKIRSDNAEIAQEKKES